MNINVGDIVLLWRPSFFMCEIYRAEVLGIYDGVDGVIQVRPLWWPFKRFIPKREVKAIWRSSAERGEKP